MADNPALSSAAVAAEVTVDPYTGETDVLWVHFVGDIGVVLDPKRARGQVIGGVMQGIGVTLHETATVTAGGTFLDHTLPLASSAPSIEVEFFGDASPSSPTGAKGLGELAIMAVPGAIANAIAAAVGRCPDRFPMTPERILDCVGLV